MQFYSMTPAIPGIALCRKCVPLLLAVLLPLSALNGDRPATAAELQGWVVRNGLAFKVADGGVKIVPDANARQACFITLQQVSLAPPVKMRVEASTQDRNLSLVPSWRVQGSRDDWQGEGGPALVVADSGEVQVLNTTLAGTGTIVHLRLRLPADFAGAMLLRRIVLTDASGQTINMEF